MWTLLLALAMSLQAHAKLFRNSYVSFELPPNWNCNIPDKGGTEWVCTGKYQQKNVKEAIIVLTAKEAGAADTLTNYQNLLKSPRRVPGATAKSNVKVVSVKTRQIAGHTWVDALHLGGEVNSYYTRYLATLKDRLAILVTFTAHKAHYTKYSNDFLKAVESLRVVASKDLLADRPNLAQRGQHEVIGGPMTTGIPVDPMATALPEEPKSGDMTMKLIAIAMILGAAGIIYWRKRKG